MTRNPLIALAVSLMAATAIGSGVACAATEPPQTALDPATSQEAPDTELANSGTHIQAMVGVHAHGYCYGVNSEEQLEQLIVESLKKDKEGNTRLDPKVCGNGRATPRNYLESFQHHDKAAGLTSVSQLPEYIRQLVKDCNPPRDVVWYTDAIEDNGATYIDFMARDFGPHECGLKNPVTGRWVIFFKCANPIGSKYVPPVVTEVQVTPPPKPPVNCYRIYLKYQGQPDVTLDANGDARVVVHLNLTDEEYQRMIADECFGIGVSIPVPDRPEWKLEKPDYERCDGCRAGHYPPPPLAIAAGLSAYKPTYTYSFPCRQESCYNSFPKWVVGHITDLEYCVDVERYRVQIPGFYGYQAVDRFNVVYQDELIRTAPSGKLDRTLSGEMDFHPVPPGSRAQ